MAVCDRRLCCVSWWLVYVPAPPVSCCYTCVGVILWPRVVPVGRGSLAVAVDWTVFATQRLVSWFTACAHTQPPTAAPCFGMPVCVLCDLCHVCARCLLPWAPFGLKCVTLLVPLSCAPVLCCAVLCVVDLEGSLTCHVCVADRSGNPP